MAPIKFEEEIKDKLEARRIEPSVKSWDKLTDRLEKEDRGGKNRFWWLAIAASVLLVLFTLIQISKSPKEVVPGDRFTIEEAPKPDVLNQPNSQENEIIDTKDAEVQQVVEVKEETTQEVIPAKQQKEASMYLAENPIKLEEQTPDEKTLPIELNTLESTEVVASKDVDESLIEEVLNESKGSTEESLNRETDSLLKAAQKELFLEKAMIEKSTVVKANELLMEVEDEVEPSLKSKVYNVFKGGFKKVKSAVAQRNN